MALIAIDCHILPFNCKAVTSSFQLITGRFEAGGGGDESDSFTATAFWVAAGHGAVHHPVWHTVTLDSK